MPGLHLSKRQAQRLWNLDARSTDVIFSALESVELSETDAERHLHQGRRRLLMTEES